MTAPGQGMGEDLVQLDQDESGNPIWGHVEVQPSKDDQRRIADGRALGFVQPDDPAGHTPTEDEVRSSYKSYVSEYRGTDYDEAGLEFNRFLAQRDRQGAAAVMRAARNELSKAALQGIEPEINHAMARLLHQAAKQIEQGGK